MKFLIVHYDSGRFLDYYYRTHPSLASLSYNEQVQTRVDSLQIWAGLYAPNLRAMGHEAVELFIADPVIQRAWARENLSRQPSESRWRFRLRRGFVPWIDQVRDGRWMWEVLEAQVRHHKPDVVFVQLLVKDFGGMSNRLRPLVPIMVGHHTEPLLFSRDHWHNYDLIVTAFPPYVDQFRKEGLNCQLLRLGFEESWLGKMIEKTVIEDIGVSFVGHLGKDFHSKRYQQLEEICQRRDVDLFSATQLEANTTVNGIKRGEVWGREMFDVFRRSKINLNLYPDFGDWGVNLRLYEATGAGGFLLTEWKPNLPELFEPDEEVGVWRSIDDLAEKIDWYLDHPEERHAVAKAGQARTLKDHTFRQRTEELLEYIKGVKR